MVHQYTESPNCDTRSNPVDLLFFNFTSSSYSASKLYHPYFHPENGASKLDILLYIFRWSILDGKLQRGESENSAKDLMVQLLIKYMKSGFDKTPKYKLCTAAQMKKKGFCDYLTVTGNCEDGVELGTDNHFDMGSVDLMNSIGGL